MLVSDLSQKVFRVDKKKIMIINSDSDIVAKHGFAVLHNCFVFNDPFGSFMHGFLEFYALPCRRFHGSPLPPGYLKTYFSVTLLITLFKLDQIMNNYK